MTFDEGLKKDIAGCASTTWFMSGEDNVIWGLTFDLGSVVQNATPPTKASTTVLLHEVPTAGRAVKLTPP
jgi:hypothetical protein